jgi:hypothetical protein
VAPRPLKWEEEENDFGGYECCVTPFFLRTFCHIITLHRRGVTLAYGGVEAAVRAILHIAVIYVA